ncbi:MAG TPA: OmpH family outer membrane protein [Steroidobacteraceae bacterium]|nr:OmpH family outer membrane protein [Steroidobacteraceae bacterium]
MSIATMSKKLVWVVALMGLALATNAHAEAKIAVVDFNHLLSEWSVTKSTLQALNDEFIPRQRALQQKQKDIEEKSKQLQRDGATYSQDKIEDLQRELAKEQRDYKTEQENANDDYQSRYNEESNKVRQHLASEVQNYAKAHGYDLVLFSGFLYVNDSLDITSQVLNYLQASAPADTKPKAAPAVKPAK